MPHPSYRLGIDVGSTTVKAALLDANDTAIYTRYRRHNADVRRELQALFAELSRDLPDTRATIAFTGSAGLGVSEVLSLPFVQEVMAGTTAVRRFIPEADIIIELGGEDAKITYLKPVLSQRMNGTCAGGTGAFIDQMAALLQTDADGLDELASRYTSLYTIASRCGVFAKSDLQPLINEGAAREDLAVSVLQAVVNQTIAGLACGQPIEGTVVFLGGPLHYMPSLRGAFERTLGSSVQTCITPLGAEVFVAVGAALSASGEPVPLSELRHRLEDAGTMNTDIPRLRPLFLDEREREAFIVRHSAAKAPSVDIAKLDGACFLGIDAGSTTLKTTLIDNQGRIADTHYGVNRGDPLGTAVGFLREMYKKLPQGAYIGGACVTGYGELLLKTALRADHGEVETMAHCKAASVFAPDVDFILDIGGQDMKCIRVRDGVMDDVLLNEACSSGCGSFISSFAEATGYTVEGFAEAACNAADPVDLGTRCTVFMNSRVKQAQKEGATAGDIAAGLSYSVIRNALYKVVGVKSPEDMGHSILVQGGTFQNDAILRALELTAGREVVRPDIAGLMGAYGAALMARERWEGGASAILPLERLNEALPSSVKMSVCRGCSNACKLTVSRFTENRRAISGQRCDSGGVDSPKSDVMDDHNLVAWKYKRVFDYQSLPTATAKRGVVGIPRALNMYEDYPFWHTLLTELGFSVVLSRRSDHKLFEAGMSTIPSESVCYPAKLAHGHIIDLLRQGVKTIFYPCVPYEHKENPEARNHFNCPIVQSYPEVLGVNVDALRQQNVKFLKPFLSLAHPEKLTGRILEEFADYKLTRREVNEALRAAIAAQTQYRADVAARGDALVAELEANGQVGIVLAGRPYHLDPEVHHGLPEMIRSLGFPVLTEDSVSHRAQVARPIRVYDQWVYHTRLYDAASFAGGRVNLEVVQLNSFGCGLDAVSVDQVREILRAQGRLHTVLKIDEMGNLGGARIRIRSLKTALEQRLRTAAPPLAAGRYIFNPPQFTQEMKRRHTILAPQMSPVHFEMVEAVFNRGGYKMEILEKLTPADVETGLKYVNNDACYPTLVVVGQLVNALLSGRYDIGNTSVFLTQTGGGCRATNYVAMLRRALAAAGFGQVPVVSLNLAGLEKNPGFSFTPQMVTEGIRAILIGDLLMQVLLRTRPYELEPKSADALYRLWLDRAVGRFRGDTRLSYHKIISGIIDDFDNLPLRDIPRKPRVGVVGEILVKFHPDANNNAVGVIEDEGCEAEVPGLLGFFRYCFYNNVLKHKLFGNSGVVAATMNTALAALDAFEHSMRRALQRSKRFHPGESIRQLAKRASTILSLGNQCGEGWLLTAEMVELIEKGSPNIICAQPFACLPNHVTGKGMIRELRRQYPQSNIVPVDYDPGASEINQLNRIKLMLSTAKSGQGFERVSLS